jgi:hypothetical protein
MITNMMVTEGFAEFVWRILMDLGGTRCLVSNSWDQVLATENFPKLLQAVRQCHLQPQDLGAVIPVLYTVIAATSMRRYTKVV